MAENMFVLDNGGGTAKAGFYTDTEPRVLPNCIMKAKSERTRPFIGDQIDDCRDVSGLYYILPHQKGYCINWDVEKTVWDYIFGKDGYKVDFPETCIVVTEPYFNFISIQEVMNEIFFEEYEFQAMLRVNCGSLSSYKYHQENPNELCCLVVDSGYSFTHIVPHVKCKKLKKGIRRIDIGGKVLTNHLKEIISYRQLHVMDETYVINQVKEDSCYVSQQFYKDMEIAKNRGKSNTIVRDYVLPDYTTIRRGFIKSQEESTGKPVENEQLLRLNNERFSIPEILFHPSDVGVQQMGISEAIVHSVKECPKEIQPHLYKNILLTGGNCLFPGFRERVEVDVRSMAPEEYEVKVTLPQNPVTYAWEGGSIIPNDPEFSRMIVTKEEYEENGHPFVLDKFDN